MIKRKQPESAKSKKHIHKKSANRKNAIRKTDGRILYAVGAVGLVLLLVFSFFVPQLIFNLRDSYLCRDIVHEDQEDMDVTFLVASYEPSLERRLRNFVEGQERGQNFYVSAQELEITQELYQQLSGFYQQDILSVMVQMGMVSYIFEETFTVNVWKQYVIFSDEYAESVNFIIWYFDLEADNGMRLKLLMDAEDKSVYGMCTERNIVLTEVQAMKWYIINLMGPWDLGMLWNFSNYYYHDISRREWGNVVFYESDKGQLKTDMNSAQNETVTMEELEAAWADVEAVSLPDDKTVIFHLPFSGQKLDFSFRLFRDENEDSAPYRYPVFYMGIDAICQLIPEFAERF